MVSEGGAGPLSDAGERVSRRWGNAIVVVVAIAVYLGTVGHGLVWDDAHLRDLVDRNVAAGGLAGLLTAGFVVGDAEHAPYYRPVVLLSLWVDGRLAKAGVPTYHITNVLLHAACCVLLLGLLRDLGARAIPSVAAVLLFAAHPVHTESVAFVSGRTDVLAGTFALGSTRLWLRVRSGRTRRNAVVAGSSLALLALAILSKEVALALPAVLFAWSLLWSPATAHPERRGSRGAWMIGWAATIAAVLVLRGLALGGIPGWAPAFDDLPRVGWISTLVGSLATYGRLLVVPWPLNAYYTADQVLPNAYDFLGSALLVALFVAVARRRSPKVAAMAAVWTAGFLIPVLGAVPLAAAPVAERFLYLPSMGFAVLTVAFRAARQPRRKTILVLATVGAVVLVLFSTATIVRNAVWRNETVFFATLTRTSPRFAEAHYNLGVVRGRAGDDDGAIASLRRALRLNPRLGVAWNNLGIVYARKGDKTEAVRSFSRAVAIDPGAGDFRENLGVALLDAGRFTDAVRTFEAMLADGVTSARVHCLLAEALASSGSRGEAIRRFEEAIRLEPDYARARFGLAQVLTASGRAEEAKQQMRRLESIDAGLASELRRRGVGN